MNKIEKHLARLQDEFNLTYSKQGAELYLLGYHGLKFKLEVKAKNYFLKAKIIDCPAKNKEVLFSYLMKANLLGQNTYGNALGLKPDEKSLTLISALDYEITYEEMQEKLELFLGARELWEKEIKTLMSKPGGLVK